MLYRQLHIHRSIHVLIFCIFFCFFLRIIWPGRSPTTQHQSVSIPPSSGASAGAGGAGSQRATTTTSSSTFFSRCVNACRGPICGFPQSSVQYPTSGEPPFIWLPPFLGLAPIFWFLILGALTSGLIAHFLASTVNLLLLLLSLNTQINIFMFIQRQTTVPVFILFYFILFCFVLFCLDIVVLLVEQHFIYADSSRYFVLNPKP